jgi:uncharacterized membrane protein
MKRINSIDFVRGLVMVIMALDHIRDLMHTTSLTQNPTDLSTVTAGVFLTRWITHLCAPIFVFLSGASAYISFKKSENLAESRRFLLSRGIWLIVLEFTIINFAIWFDIHFRILMLQVICAIGVGLIVLAFLLKFAPRNIGIAGLVIIFSHNLLQGISFPQNPALNFVSSVLFGPNFFQITPNFAFLVGYPIIPWLGIMLLGYGFGHFFAITAEKRRKLFLQFGGGGVITICSGSLHQYLWRPCSLVCSKNTTFYLLFFYECYQISTFSFIYVSYFGYHVSAIGFGRWHEKPCD